MEGVKDIKQNNSREMGKPEPEKTGNGFWKRESEMLKFKALYFLEFAHLGSIHPYIPFIARYDIGLSATSFSISILLQKIIAFLIKPSIGYIADYFKKIKLMIILLSLIGIVCYFLLSVIPKIEPVTLQRNEKVFVITDCRTYHCNSSEANVNESLFIVVAKGSLLLGKSCQYSFNISCGEGEGDYLGNTSAVIFTKSMPIDRTLAAFCEIIPNPSYSIAECVESTCRQLGCIGSTWDPISGDTTESKVKLNGPTQIRTNNTDYIFADCEFTTNRFSKCFTTNSSGNISDDNVPIHGTSTNNCLISGMSMCGFNASFGVDCGTPIRSSFADNASRCENKSISDYQTYQFYVFTILCIVGIMTTDCLLTLIDTACLEQAKTTGHDFGRQAVWSSIGFGIVSIFVGYLVVLTESHSVVYGIMVGTGIVATATAAFVRCAIPGTSKSIMADFAVVAKSEDFAFFAFGAFLNGVGYGAVVYHCYWYIDSIGADGVVVGLAVSESQFAKAAFFLVSGWILGRFDPHHVTSISILSYAVRCLSLSFLGNPYWILAVEWLHGVTALYYHCAVAFAKSSSKPGTENLVQSVISSLYLCFGVAFGAIIAGVGFDYIGGRYTYLLFGEIFGILAVLNFMYTLNLNRRKRKKQSFSTEDQLPEIKKSSVIITK